MLANFYLHGFDRRMLNRGFNLVHYADDFVVMCRTEEQAREVHRFAENAPRALKLRIHALDVPDSKSKIGDFSKDGLTFLGIRFEGPSIYPAKKVVDRFKGKVAEVLKPASGDSLFKTLQRLTNLINGWGKCYKAMRVYDDYVRLDKFIKESVEAYLRNVGIHLAGKNKRRQMKLLGIPSLVGMVEHAIEPTETPPAVSPLSEGAKAAP